MSFLGVVLSLVELVWCFVMPILGSLHLISSKYAQENSSKSDLLKHWCFYWMAFVLLQVFSGFIVILPDFLIKVLRVGVLAAMASPKFGVTLHIYEEFKNHADHLIEIKTIVFAYIRETIFGYKSKSA